MKKVISKKNIVRNISLAVFLVVLAALAFLIKSNYTKSIMTKILIYVMLASSLNIINGYSGQFNLGHAGFYCIGAYAYAIMATKLGMSFWPMLLISGLLAAAVGYLVSLPTLRLKGMYLAMVTMGASEIIRIIALNWDSLTSGANGIKGIPAPRIFGFIINKTTYYYLLILALVVLMLFLTNRIMKSRVGRAWLSIREDQNAARFLGVEVNRQKSINFMLGAFWAGVAGCFAASYYQYIAPSMFTLDEGFKILLMMILGGQGTMVGPIIGAVVVNLTTEFLRFASFYRMLIYSALIIVMMWFKPHGLVSIGSDIVAWVSKLRKKRLSSKEKANNEKEPMV